ncbi:hypothetical protein CYG49_00290 [Candidatus Saccharibacteria bacterium]|nr:MAG: hypothetical protein CYG49_00290 [Candidatus Saccharibacteria bacterium]
MATLEVLEAELLETFRQSGVDQWGGFSGTLAEVGDEPWRVGYSPGEIYFAGISPERGPVRQYLSYSLDPRDPGAGVQRRNKAEYADHHLFWVDLNAHARVTDPAELRWLIDLLKAVGDAGKDGTAHVEPFAKSE